MKFSKSEKRTINAAIALATSKGNAELASYLMDVLVGSHYKLGFVLTQAADVANKEGDKEMATSLKAIIKAYAA